LSSASGPPAAGITPEQWATLSSLHRQVKTQLASIQEGPEKTDLDMLRRAGDLRDLPLVVLTAGRLSADADSVEERRRQAARIESLGELARKSTRGRQIVVTNSGHMIPYEAPETVNDAVLAVVTEIQHPHGAAH
jgi:pimeloyl-ACP methyl ester carboxylesterase